MKTGSTGVQIYKLPSVVRKNENELVETVRNNFLFFKESNLKYICKGIQYINISKILKLNSILVTILVLKGYTFDIDTTLYANY